MIVFFVSFFFFWGQNVTYYEISVTSISGPLQATDTDIADIQISVPIYRPADISVDPYKSPNKYSLSDISFKCSLNSRSPQYLTYTKITLESVHLENFHTAKSNPTVDFLILKYTYEFH